MIPIPAIGSFLVSNWRLVAFGILLAALGIQTWRLGSCQTSYQEFRVSTEAIARAQKAKNEAIREANEKLTQEVVDAKDKMLADLSTRYARARRDARRVPVNPGSGSLPAAPEAPALASACLTSNPAIGGVDRDKEALSARLAEVEAALLDLMEKADAEMVKYRQLWAWAQGVR